MRSNPRSQRPKFCLGRERELVCITIHMVKDIDAIHKLLTTVDKKFAKTTPALMNLMTDARAPHLAHAVMTSPFWRLLASSA